jgi:hypothetical protein
MYDERKVKKLQGKLRQLDSKRAAIKAELDRIMLAHIEAIPIKDAQGAEGDAGLFSRYSKARLMDIVEQHWRIHHMFAIEKFEDWTKEEMVNYVLDIKGLPGHYKKPPTRERSIKDRAQLSSIVW